jgi:4-hydroxy-tetrahydrodipicolinate synthase
VKEACGDLAQISELIARCPDGFDVLSGDDALTLAMLSIGARGVISTSSNVAPVEMCELVRAFRAGDAARARALHYQLLPLFDALFCETNPIPVKAALHLMGQIGPEIRLPLTSIEERNRERLQVVLKEVGVI